MITKEEWREWAGNKVTKQLLILIQAGSNGATQELVSARGDTSNGDYYRGAIRAYEDMLQEVIHGENIWDEEEE